MFLCVHPYACVYAYLCVCVYVCVYQLCVKSPNLYL